MLVKLLKYESKATIKKLLPFYITTVVLFLLSKASINLFYPSVNKYSFPTLPLLYTGILVVPLMACIVISIFTLIIQIVSFKKDLFSDRGYLMFTLPVKTHQIVLSKLIVATVAIVLAQLIGYAISLDYNYALNINNFNALKTNLVPILQHCINSLLSSVCSIITIYTCISIGHLFSKCRTLISIASYIAIGLCENFIRTKFISTLRLNGSSEIWINCIITALIIVAEFFATNYILSKKLNLE